MKPSLEDERRALLEHIEASRAVYRRMLSDAPSSGTWHLPHSGTASRPAAVGAAARAMRWMTTHPMWVAGGIALFVLLMPRVLKSGQRATRNPSHPPRESSQPGGTLRSLLTVTSLLLQDPARMRSATKLARSAWHWLRNQRSTEPLPEHVPSKAARTNKLH